MELEFSHLCRLSDDAHHPAWLGTKDPARRASALERVGFDRVVIDHGRDSAANIEIAASLLRSNPNLELAIAIWAGELAPVETAQALARLEGQGASRVSVSLRPSRVSGTSIAARMDQLGEYATLLKRLWLSERPFDYEGAHYSLTEAHCDTRAAIALRIGGRSGLAQNVAAQVCDVFDLPAGDLSETAATIARVKGFAVERGRASQIAFALPVALDGGTVPAGIALTGEPLRDALVLLDYLEVGVSEFVLQGTDEAALAFARDVMPLVRNSATRRFGREVPDVVSEPWQRAG